MANFYLDKNRLIEYQKSAIAKILRPSQIVPALTADNILSASESEDILKRESRTSTEQAATVLLNKLIRDNKSGWAASFDRAVQEQELSAIGCILEDFSKPDELDMYTKFLNLFLEYIVEIIPSDLYTYLHENKCLSTADMERLKKMEKCESMELVVFTMLRMIAKRPDYAGHLLNSLKAVNSTLYCHIIDNLEPQLEKTGFTIHEQFEKFAKVQMKCRNEPVESDELPASVHRTFTVSSRSAAADHANRNTVVVTPYNHHTDHVTDAPIEQYQPDIAGVTDMHVDDTDALHFRYEEHPTDVPLEASLPTTQYDIVAPVCKQLKLSLDHDRNSMRQANININDHTSIETATAFRNETTAATSYTPVMNLQEITLKTNQNEVLSPNDILSEEAREEFSDITPTKLKLMSFQEELAKPCIGGLNKIVVAPTNSGKTFVAMAITKDHLEKRNVVRKRAMSHITKKVVFLVPKVCLAMQQHRQFSTHLSQFKTWHMTGHTMFDPSERIPIDVMFKAFDIIVMTPQILVQGLKSNAVTFQDISLLIFDECHNTRGGHPMSLLMKLYLIEKIEKNSTDLPQIVGLTASVGIGKTTEQFAAMDQIFKLCAVLDATIHTVRKERDALNKHLKTKIKKVEAVRPRHDDKFGPAILDITRAIETKLMSLAALIPGLQRERNDDINELPTAGTQQYIQRIVQLRNNVTEMKEKRRGYRACLDYLEMFSKGLSLYMDCNASDAMKDIELKHFEIRREDAEDPDETEQWLAQLFEERHGFLQEIAKTDINPKLKRLKEVILQYLVEKEERARAMVMVSTRDLTVAIAKFLEADVDMKQENLLVGRFVGITARTADAGMTQNQWVQTLNLFKRGTIKVLICTNVAEEGLDIPDCNLLVKYELSQNEVSKVQAEGRARADNAMIVTLSSNENNNIERDALMEEKVQLMHQCVDLIYNMDPRSVMQKIKPLQMDIVSEENRRIRKELLQDLSRKKPVEEYTLICNKCERNVCRASYIRRYDEQHHVVLDETFPDRLVYKVLKPNRKKLMISLFQKECKIHCKHCSQSWGVMLLAEGKMVFMLSQGNFHTVRDNGERDICMKWDDIPFKFEDITYKELIDIAQYYVPE